MGFKRKIVFLAVLAVILAGFGWWNFMAEREGNLPPAASLPGSQDVSLNSAPPAASVAKNLEIPWALDFLPDGSIIFTERAGRIRLIDARRGLLPEPLLTIETVAHTGEGGLLGIAVHPNFTNSQFIYVYYTYRDQGNLANKVVRFRKQGESLVDEKRIIEGIPGAFIHNGGRIKFGPDRLLYITTGDASNPDLAQDKNSLAGKILRLNDDGTIPTDNPFPGSPIYSLGHRNPQGLAWDPQGRLWETEHGSHATDELNLIKPGKNYGWPDARGDEKSAGIESPVIQSGRETWAPSGAAYLNGSIFFTGLRGQSLYEAKIDARPVELSRHLNKKFGRLREVVTGPDNFLYLLTNNRDGRGIPTAEDDQVIKINPEKLV